MKCKNCRSCLVIVRIDKEEESKVYYYCTLCKSVFDFYGSRELVKDLNAIKEVQNKYKELKGNII